MIRSLVLVLTLALPLAAATAPFPKPARPRILTREGLVGTWSVQWGTVPATVTLSATGEYACQWPGSTYVGTWGVDRDGRLCITESCQVAQPNAWQSYAIRLNAGSLAGPIEGSPEGIVVRFQKKQ